MGAGVPRDVADARPLDLDDVGPQVAEHHAGEGAGEHPRQVEDSHAFERSHGDLLVSSLDGSLASGVGASNASQLRCVVAGSTARRPRKVESMNGRNCSDKSEGRGPARWKPTRTAPLLPCRALANQFTEKRDPCEDRYQPDRRRWNNRSQPCHSTPVKFGVISPTAHPALPWSGTLTRTPAPDEPRQWRCERAR